MNEIEVEDIMLTLKTATTAQLLIVERDLKIIIQKKMKAMLAKGNKEYYK